MALAKTKKPRATLSLPSWSRASLRHRPAWATVRHRRTCVPPPIAGAGRREVVWQMLPRAASAKHIQHAVQHLPQGPRPGPPCLGRLGHKRGHNGPLDVSQVGCTRDVIARKLRAGGGSPHGQLLENVRHSQMAPLDRRRSPPSRNKAQGHELGSNTNKESI